MAVRIPQLQSNISGYLAAAEMIARAGQIRGAAIAGVGEAIGTGLARAADRNRAEKKLGIERSDRKARESEQARQFNATLQQGYDRLSIDYLKDSLAEETRKEVTLGAAKAGGAQIPNLDAALSAATQKRIDADAALRAVLTRAAGGMAQEKAPAVEDFASPDDAAFWQGYPKQPPQAAGIGAPPKVCEDGTCDVGATPMMDPEMLYGALKAAELGITRATDLQKNAKSLEEVYAASDLMKRNLAQFNMASKAVEKHKTVLEEGVKEADAARRDRYGDVNREDVQAHQFDMLGRRIGATTERDVRQNQFRFDMQATRLADQAERDRFKAEEAGKQKEKDREVRLRGIRAKAAKEGVSMELGDIDSQIAALDAKAKGFKERFRLQEFQEIQEKIAGLHMAKAEVQKSARTSDGASAPTTTPTPPAEKSKTEQVKAIQADPNLSAREKLRLVKALLGR